MWWGRTHVSGPRWTRAAARAGVRSLSSTAVSGPAPAPVRHSGLQQEVLSLYRECLRMVRTKPKETQARFHDHIRTTFRQQAASVQARDFSTIEFLLRRGRKQLEMLQDPQLLDIHPTTTGASLSS